MSQQDDSKTDEAINELADRLRHRGRSDIVRKVSVNKGPVINLQLTDLFRFSYGIGKVKIVISYDEGIVTIAGTVHGSTSLKCCWPIESFTFAALDFDAKFCRVLYELGVEWYRGKRIARNAIRRSVPPVDISHVGELTDIDQLLLNLADQLNLSTQGRVNVDRARYVTGWQNDVLELDSSGDLFVRIGTGMRITYEEMLELVVAQWEGNLVLSPVAVDGPELNLPGEPLKVEMANPDGFDRRINDAVRKMGILDFSLK